MRLVSGCDRGADAGAWVLGALDEHEATTFAEHLEGCAMCRDEVADLQAVADILPMAAEQIAPTRSLRASVMAAIDAEMPAGAGRAEAGVARQRARRVRRAMKGTARPALALAAVASVAAGVVAGGALKGDPSHLRIPSHPRTVPANVDASVAPGARASLIVDRGLARLHMTHLPQVPKGRVYQVWVQRLGHAPKPTDALFTVRSDGSATVGVPGRLANVRRILVTSEPQGGSEVPSTRPIVVAEPS